MDRRVLIDWVSIETETICERATRAAIFEIEKKNGGVIYRHNGHVNRLTVIFLKRIVITAAIVYASNTCVIGTLATKFP